MHVEYSSTPIFRQIGKLQVSANRRFLSQYRFAVSAFRCRVIEGLGTIELYAV